MNPPDLTLVTGLERFPDAPEGVVCWSGRVSGTSPVPVHLILQDQPVASLDAGFIDAVCADAGRWLRVAADAAGLEGDPASWDPEINFRAGREWAVRFTEAPGRSELGIMVVFTGECVTAIDDLEEWEDA
ncbi:hypothetical protein ACTI_57890 [Actinoplanes sp. OR16]|uniref:hypothetical protein n=1 Tax=Actinoplanes sp. OR16 TaxID=946334 RepID=UPI000F6DC410|nr:hypothetical protein [Actinoplanes sp. OR16]BBH69104.1 hypothetical protein ACTI_57890 [Actinoplanes sp. OR16]